MIKDVYKKMFRTVFSPVFQLLYKSHVLTPRMIIRVDGGICSQIHFYLIGCLFREKGYEVEFDLSWYAEKGTDMDGRHLRNFDLLKLFPRLPFRQASFVSRRLYRCLYCHLNDYFSGERLSYLDLLPPRYLAGYYQDSDSLYRVKFGQYFRIDRNVLDGPSMAVLERIAGVDNAVAVHVRRGDLSGYNPAYGQPASIRYFAEAMAYLAGRHEGCRYFFFSDEPEWCREYLVPVVPEGASCEVVDVNGSDKGYMDLVLMAHCRHQIASKGTIGKYAALLKQRRGEVVICNDDVDRVWGGRLPDSVLIPT